MEELRDSIIKLTGDKLKLWTRQESVAEAARAIKSLATATWQADEKVTNCMSCEVEFSIFVRRHHCRLCGQIFCHDCSSLKVQLAASDAPERVCNPCHSMIMTVNNNNDVLSDDQKTGSTIGALAERSGDTEGSYVFSGAATPGGGAANMGMNAAAAASPRAQGWTNGYARQPNLDESISSVDGHGIYEETPPGLKGGSYD